MSFFNTGFEDYEKELVHEEEKSKQGKENAFAFSLKVNESKEFIVLDDTGFRFYEYTFFNRIINRPISFTSRGDNDFLAEAKRPSLITVMTVKDLSGSLDKNGERKYVGSLRLLKLKKNAAKRINVLRQTLAAQAANQLWETQKTLCEQRGHKSVEEVAAAILRKGEVLKLCRLRATRFGDKSESSGDDFQFIAKVKPEALKPEDKPFNYEELFAPKTDEEIKAELISHYRGVDNFDSSLLPLKKYFQGMSYTGQVEESEPMPSEQYGNRAVAPDFNSEDIPF